MQYPDMTIRIEMVGNLVLEIKKWTECLEYEEDEDAYNYCSQRLQETLDAYREFRVYLLKELEDYVQLCKEANIPVDLGYYRIKKELSETNL